MSQRGGRAVQIVKIDDESETHNFVLDEDALHAILNRDSIRDKPICIVSVAGGARLRTDGPNYTRTAHYCAVPARHYYADCTVHSVHSGPSAQCTVCSVQYQYCTTVLHCTTITDYLNRDPIRVDNVAAVPCNALTS
jgi:hypothetical protein